MARPDPPITDIGLPLDTEYADDVDFNDEDEENLRALLPFVNEDKTDFTHVYLAEKGAKDDAVRFAVNTLQLQGRRGRPQSNLFSLILKDLSVHRISLNSLLFITRFRLFKVYCSR